MQRREADLGSGPEMHVRRRVRASPLRVPVVDKQLVVAATQLVEVSRGLDLPRPARTVELDDAVVLRDRQADPVLALQGDGISITESERVGGLRRSSRRTR